MNELMIILLLAGYSARRNGRNEAVGRLGDVQSDEAPARNEESPAGIGRCSGQGKARGRIRHEELGVSGRSGTRNTATAPWLASDSSSRLHQGHASGRL